MQESSKIKQIKKIVIRIERSPLSAQEYIQRYGAPFSLAQYYRYRARISEEGEEGLKDKRHNEHRRKLKAEHIGFVRGYVRTQSNWSLPQIQQVVDEEFGIKVDLSTISRALKKLDIPVPPRQKKAKDKKEQVSRASDTV